MARADWESRERIAQEFPASWLSRLREIAPRPLLRFPGSRGQPQAAQFGQRLQRGSLGSSPECRLRVFTAAVPRREPRLLRVAPGPREERCGPRERKERGPGGSALPHPLPRTRRRPGIGPARPRSCRGSRSLMGLAECASAGVRPRGLPVRSARPSDAPRGTRRAPVGDEAESRTAPSAALPGFSGPQPPRARSRAGTPSSELPAGPRGAAPWWTSHSHPPGS